MRFLRSEGNIIWYCVLLVCLAVNAHGSDLSALSDEEIDRRYNFIESRLNSDRQHAYWWQHGWEGVYGVSALVQTGRAIDADNSDDEINFGVSALKSAAAFAAMYFNRLPAIDGADSLALPPDAGRAQKIERLRRAEQLLEQRALRAESIHTFKRHGTAILFNLLTAGVVAAYGDEKDAIASAVGGIALSELNIWTQPNQGEKDWQDYQSGRLSRGSEVSWSVKPRLDGFLVQVNF